jgi:hypothetical protein
MRILDACETTMRRIETEPDFAHPSRFLFEEVRTCLPIGEQEWARRLIEVHVIVARELQRRLPPDTRECAAFTRAGTPCQREPSEGSNYCPSHRHLEVMDLELGDADTASA